MAYYNVPKTDEYLSVAKSDLSYYANTGILEQQFGDGGSDRYMLVYNDSGSTINAGSVVVIDSANISASDGIICVKAAGDKDPVAIVLGVAAASAPDGSLFWIKISGIATCTAYTNGGSAPITPNDYVSTYTGGKVRKSSSNPEAFGIALSAATNDDDDVTVVFFL